MAVRRPRTLLEVIQSERNVHKRTAALRARASGNRGAMFRGSSVLADRMPHSGFVSVASVGQLRNAPRATAAENAAFRKAQAKRASGKSAQRAAASSRSGVANAAATVAGLASRRTRRRRGGSQSVY